MRKFARDIHKDWRLQARVCQSQAVVSLWTLRRTFKLGLFDYDRSMKLLWCFLRQVGLYRSPAARERQCSISLNFWEPVFGTVSILQSIPEVNFSSLTLLNII